MKSPAYYFNMNIKIFADLQVCISVPTRLLAIISPYLAKFMKNNKSNAAFLHDILTIFSPIYLFESIPNAMIIP